MEAVSNAGWRAWKKGSTIGRLGRGRHSPGIGPRASLQPWRSKATHIGLQQAAKDSLRTLEPETSSSRLILSACGSTRPARLRCSSGRPPTVLHSLTRADADRSAPPRGDAPRGTISNKRGAPRATYASSPSIPGGRGDQGDLVAVIIPPAPRSSGSGDRSSR